MDDAVTVVARQHREVCGLLREVSRQPSLTEDADGAQLRRTQSLVEDLLPSQVLAVAGHGLARPGPLDPTRPHPDLPATPILGPVLGVIDRIVEAFAFGPTGS